MQTIKIWNQCGSIHFQKARHVKGLDYGYKNASIYKNKANYILVIDNNNGGKEYSIIISKNQVDNLNKLKGCELINYIDYLSE